MPYILDKATNEVRGVSDLVYDQWIQQTDRFAPAPEQAPTPSITQEDGQSSASDLVGTGQATPALPATSPTEASPAQETTPTHET